MWEVFFSPRTLLGSQGIFVPRELEVEHAVGDERLLGMVVFVVDGANDGVGVDFDLKLLEEVVDVGA